MSEFYIPEGYRDGFPKVQVSSEVIKEFDMPDVDFDALEELYYDDLDLPRRETPDIYLQETRFAAAYYKNYRKKTVINPRVIFSLFGEELGMSMVLLHEGQHMADFSNRPIRSYGEIAMEKTGQVTLAFTGAKLGMEIPSESIDTAAKVGSGILGAGIGYYGSLILTLFEKKHLSILEKRARKKQYNTELIHKYRDAIQFPNVDQPIRAEKIEFVRKQLGWED